MHRLRSWPDRDPAPANNLDRLLKPAFGVQFFASSRSRATMRQNDLVPDGLHQSLWPWNARDKSSAPSRPFMATSY